MTVKKVLKKTAKKKVSRKQFTPLKASVTKKTGHKSVKKAKKPTSAKKKPTKIKTKTLG